MAVFMQTGWSVEGLERIQRHAQELLPRLFPLQADCYAAAAPPTLQPVSLIDTVPDWAIRACSCLPCDSV